MSDRVKCAGVHADQERWQVHEEFRLLVATQLLPDNSLAAFVDAVDLKHILCQINAYRYSLYCGRSGSVKGMN